MCTSDGTVHPALLSTRALSTRLHGGFDPVVRHPSGLLGRRAMRKERAAADRVFTYYDGLAQRLSDQLEQPRQVVEL